MNAGKPITSQAIEYFPLPTYHQRASQYQGENKVKSFSCDIESCLWSQSAKLFQMGIRGPTSRNSLDNTNEVGDSTLRHWCTTTEIYLHSMGNPERDAMWVFEIAQEKGVTDNAI